MTEVVAAQRLVCAAFRYYMRQVGALDRVAFSGELRQLSRPNSSQEWQKTANLASADALALS